MGKSIVSKGGCPKGQHRQIYLLAIYTVHSSHAAAIVGSESDLHLPASLIKQATTCSYF